MMRPIKIIVPAVVSCVLCAGWLAAPSFAQDEPKPAPAGEATTNARPAADVPPPPMHPDGDPKRLERRPTADGRMPVQENTAELEAGLPGPRDGRRWMDGGPGRGRPELSPELVDRLMEVVRDLDADRAAKLEALRSSNPKEFGQTIARSGRHLLGLSMLKDRDPELYSLRIDELRKGQEINRIAQEIRAARDTCSDAELERLTTMLRSRIREQTELNFRARGRELVLLENHLRTTREKLQEDIQRRDEAIDERLEELLAAPDDPESDAFAVDRSAD